MSLIIVLIRNKVKVRENDLTYVKICDINSKLTTKSTIPKRRIFIMATQFLIPDSARVNTHLTVSINTEVSSYTGLFAVNIDAFGMEIPKGIVDLFNIEVSKRGGTGSINRRIYSSDMQAFLNAFEEYCYDNLTSKANKGTEVVYYYVPNSPLESFSYSSYQKDELTIQFKKDEIIFYLDGKEVPEVYNEIHKSFIDNNIESSVGKNKRIITYSVNPGYFDIKSLVQSVIVYLGTNEYQIVNVEESQYCIDMRNDESKGEVISIEHFAEFVGQIDFQDEPEASLTDLFHSLSGGLASALLLDENPVIDVVSTTVN
jgi:hypothetical protein